MLAQPGALHNQAKKQRNGDKHQHRIGQLKAEKVDGARRHLAERLIERLGGHAVCDGEGSALAKMVDDSTAGGLHGQRGNHGGHASLGHKKAVKGTDQRAEGQREQEHYPDVLGIVEHIDAKAGDDRHLRADGNIDLPGADDHRHAQRDNARHGGLYEDIGDIAPNKKVGVDDDGNNHNQNKGYQIAVIRKQFLPDIPGSQLPLRLTHA